MNNYPQFQDGNTPRHGPNLSDYDGNYYPSMAPLMQANCTRIPSPRMSAPNDNMALGDQYLSPGYHPFIPIPYQYSQNFFSDKHIANNQRGYYPPPRKYDQKKANKKQSHLHPSHDLDDHNIKDDTRNNNTSHPTHDVNQVKIDTNTKNNIENRQHKNNESTTQ